MNISALEQHRLQLQSNCDQQRSQLERNRLGQFATPFLLANEIVSESVRLLGSEQPIHFLDPAFGSGAFYSALLHVAPERVASAVGFEVDSHYGIPAQELWANTKLDLRIADFTRTAIAEPSVNLLVCNPPYVRHHHLSSVQKSKLRNAAKSMGSSLSGLAGLYCYFMILAHQSLLPGAISAWLIPSEFMDVNYGDEIKGYLLEKVTLLRIHRFDPNEVQFTDALVSSAVIWFRNAPPVGTEPITLTFGGNLATPHESSAILGTELRSRPKWTQLHNSPDQSPEKPSVRLGDLFTIKRGLATGDNGFFILSEERIAELGISHRFLKPILPSPRHVKDDVVKGDKNGVPILSQRLFLVDCPLDEDELRKADPALADYVNTGRSTAATGYLCKSRTPWYSQENRPPAPFLCTYMGRSDGNGGKTFRFILNQSSATAANVYLLMYPKATVRDALAKPEVAERVFELLTKIPMHRMTSEGRVYGGGLHKLEPRELANVPADEIAAVLLEGRDRHFGYEQLDMHGKLTQ